MPQRGANIKTQLKYREAVSLYAMSCLSLKEICEKANVGFVGFCNYLSKYHRDLILIRHNLSGQENARLRGRKGQTTVAHYKYKEAIAACDSREYIEYNISQIARLFNVDCCSLAGQLRRHYPDIVPHREQERRRMGITVTLQYGARKWCKEEYAQAVEMLQTSDLTVEEAAQRGMTKTSDGKLVSRRSQEKYAEALHLYQATTETLKSITKRLGLTYKSVGGFIRRIHPEAIQQHKALVASLDEGGNNGQLKARER